MQCGSSENHQHGLKHQTTFFSWRSPEFGLSNKRGIHKMQRHWGKIMIEHQIWGYPIYGVYHMRSKSWQTIFPADLRQTSRYFFRSRDIFRGWKSDFSIANLQRTGCSFPYFGFLNYLDTASVLALLNCKIVFWRCVTLSYWWFVWFFFAWYRKDVHIHVCEDMLIYIYIYLFIFIYIL